MRSMLGAKCAALMVFGMLAVTTTASAQGSAPVVSNVVAQQIPGTGNVRVTYDVSDADGDSVFVSLVVSFDNGANFNILPRTITGDVYKRVAVGIGREAIWSASVDYPGFYYSSVIAKIIVNDGAPSEMVLVPGGQSPIGSTTVYISSFLIDRFEITNAEYQRFMDAGGYTTQAYWSSNGWAAKVSNNWTQPLNWNSKYVGPSAPGYPVTGVSWYEAEAYANFVGKRLPTEAEWEKACRGSTNNRYAWGDSLDPRRVNYYQSRDPNDDNPTPVGYYNGTLYFNSFQTIDSPSPFGAYDLNGNVNEWVQDFYSSGSNASYPSSASNPTGTLFGTGMGSARIVKGGSYGSNPSSSYLFTHRLYGGTPTSINAATRDAWTGFRLARTVGP
jgi:formylglycine-generating enzyme required for sulfatase activity